MRWTRKNIVEEIKRLHASGAALSYALAQAEHLNLVRAAAWHFGTWRHAVEKAGIPYEDISKYRRWNHERIIARIRELHQAGADLSWRTISTQTDPPLAAAALRPNGFGSWREAISAAGLDADFLARYRHWDEERVKSEIRRLHRARVPLSSRSAQQFNQPLFCAARRRFGSWDQALQHAGFSASEIRLRRPCQSHAVKNASLQEREGPHAPRKTIQASVRASNQAEKKPANSHARACKTRPHPRDAATIDKQSPSSKRRAVTKSDDAATTRLRATKS